MGKLFFIKIYTKIKLTKHSRIQNHGGYTTSIIKKWKIVSLYAEFIKKYSLLKRMEWNRRIENLAYFLNAFCVQIAQIDTMLIKLLILSLVEHHQNTPKLQFFFTHTHFFCLKSNFGSFSVREITFYLSHISSPIPPSLCYCNIYTKANESLACVTGQNG